MADEPIDPFVAMRAALDQAMASFTETARLLRGHYEAHVEAGFTEAQALALTRDFHGALIRGEIGGEDG